ncbi:MATE family efflux transporter [Nakamurella endophytica]|uniref:MATE family efflux transporter n=1 Tax=Nakamurella endophytica TaxID=1748367 RepID=A0A917SVH2_9ACTN|nr:MATE family efflux transporter [Nakamurella endophytica]GGM00859.1 MATE family efflux transporter [Nakamurella endophytica]
MDVTDTGDPGTDRPGAAVGTVSGREILRLAVPALGALLAEPTFLAVDVAIIGHLGTAALAGVGVAAVALSTVVGLAVFLAYGTTAQVARAVGAGRPGSAYESGVAGLYLAAVLGVAVAVAGVPLAPLVVSALGAHGEAAALGALYLRISLAGVPGTLVVLAATGVIRGLQDTRTPLVVAVAGAVVNTVVNVLLVLVLRLGVGGSAAGTAAVQTAMAVVLAAVVVRGARRSRTAVSPHWGRVAAVGRDGIALFVRTATLRVAILVATAVAARQGVVALAGHQVVTAVWNWLALALDALAIAAQALTGRALGAGDAPAARAATDRLVRWGCSAGAVLGACVLAGCVALPQLFSADPGVRSAVTAALVAVAVALPLGGYVFVLDGVLIGAGDGRYLAWAGVASLLAFLPAAVAVALSAPRAGTGLVWLWAAYLGVYLVARAVTLGLRYRRDGWLVLGAGR